MENENIIKNHIGYLKRIRFFNIVLLLCAVTLTALGIIVGGVVALILAFFVVWRYHRCAKCGAEVSTLLPLDKTTCCPTCGFYLNDGTEPEEMREERERAEAEAKAKAEAEAAEKAAAEAEAADAEAEGAETAEQEEGAVVDMAV